MIPIQSVEKPEALLLSLLPTMADGEQQWLALRFPLVEYYLADKPVRELLAIACVVNRSGTMQLGCAVLEWREGLVGELTALAPEQAAVQQWCNDRGCPWFVAGMPVQLSPIAIAKPWGQEIWYTGIEARGQSNVAAQGFTVPLPWLLALAPRYFVGGLQQQVNLLKILDPLPEPVYGDLYFELHEEKQEVYVVTHIDQEAWPAGQGGIRFGFSKAKRQQFGSDAEFKQAYQAAVKEYEQVRREIDLAIDAMRAREGVDLNAPVSAECQKQWAAQLPAELCTAEVHKRELMESFTAVKPLHLGDVVKVPCFTPHSLLHGVRTVEFQTPVYERKILSFAQKVLTQSHWDTDAAVDLMAVEAPPQPPFITLLDDGRVRVERIVDFDDFTVLRVVLQAGAEYQDDSTAPYRIIMSLSDGLQVNRSVINREEAVLMRVEPALHLANTAGNDTAIALISVPKTSAPTQ